MCAADEALCQSCGACCAYSADWPRFGLESDAALAAIPRAYVDDARADALRWQPLRGADRRNRRRDRVSVYAVRPLVCRECQPGDDSECPMARRHFTLAGARRCSALIASAAAATPVR